MFCLLYLYLDVSASLYRMINGQSCFHIHLCAHIKSQFNVYIIARLFNITTRLEAIMAHKGNAETLKPPVHILYTKNRLLHVRH